MNLIVAVIILLFCIIAGARHLSSYRANSPANHARRKFELLSRVMRCLGKLSMLDGTFSEEEKISLQIISDKFYPDTKIDQCELEKFFNSGKDSRLSFEKILNDLVQSIKRNNAPVEFKTAIITIFCAHCVTDGSLHAQELKVLKYAASKLGEDTLITLNQYLSKYARRQKQSQQREYQYQEQQSSSKASKPQNTMAECYRILGISPDADNAAVKKAYRKKAAEFHPDKVQGAGLPEEFTTFAKEQFQKISNAYETICKARNIN